MVRIALAGIASPCLLLPPHPPQAPSLIEHDSVFRKRALHRGAAIGYHRQEEDEIYYVVSGTGELTLNGVRAVVIPGTAILTRPGSSHGVRQVGFDDLVVIIVYQQSGRAQAR